MPHPGGGGVHNMLRVRVCAAHMGGFLGRNSLDKGPLFGRFSINMGGLSRNWRKMAKMGRFPPKFIIKVGMTEQVSVIRGEYFSEIRAADPRPSPSHVPPPPRDASAHSTPVNFLCEIFFSMQIKH